MPLFSFRTENDGRLGASDPCELAGPDEGWQELTKVCGDFVSEGCRNLKPNSEWSMALLDSKDTPLFRIRLVAETLAIPLVLVHLVPLLGEGASLV
jgi:hypothetical protein